MENKNVSQFSLSKVLLLIFIPALFILGTYGAALGLRQTIPPFLSFMVIIFLVLIPMELGIILYYSKKEYGALNLKSAFTVYEKIPVTHMIGLSVILFTFGALVFSFVSPIETRFMFRTIFKQVPEYFKLSDFLVQYKDYSRGMVIVSLILFTIGNGVIGPIVEELYFRGFLMPRLSRFGAWSPVIIGVLFSLYHLFSPWENATRILACIPFVYCVYRRKNLFIGIIVHCSLNLASVIMLVESILSDTGFWQGS